MNFLFLNLITNLNACLSHKQRGGRGREWLVSYVRGRGLWLCHVCTWLSMGYCWLLLTFVDFRWLPLTRWLSLTCWLLHTAVDILLSALHPLHTAFNVLYHIILLEGELRGEEGGERREGRGRRERRNKYDTCATKGVHATTTCLIEHQSSIYYERLNSWRCEGRKEEIKREEGKEWKIKRWKRSKLYILVGDQWSWLMIDFNGKRSRREKERNLMDKRDVSVVVSLHHPFSLSPVTSSSTSIALFFFWVYETFLVDK